MQPLDYCVNSTRRTLGLADVHCFSGELVEPLSYKYLLPFFILTCPSTVNVAPRLPDPLLVCFVRFVSFRCYWRGVIVPNLVLAIERTEVRIVLCKYVFVSTENHDCLQINFKSKLVLF
jgi:hypothetical protein